MMKRPNRARLALAATVAAVLLLSGCAAGRPPRGGSGVAGQSQWVVVSFRDPGAVIPDSGAVSWLPGGTLFVDDARLSTDRMEEIVRGAIRKELEAKGFVFVHPVQSDLQVGYTIALESALDDKTLDAMYGFNTGLTPRGGASRKYEKGTLIVDIVRRGATRPLWRGALQAQAEFNVREKVRKDRIRAAVAQLLRRFPR